MPGQKLRLAILSASATALLGSPAYAQDRSGSATTIASASQSFGSIAGQQSSPSSLSDPFSVFAPSQNPIEHTIDYSIWDEAMGALVLSMGPSLRKTAGRPDPIFGTRRQYGHVSRYRLEGSLMAFAFMNREVKASFTEYRRDLEAVSETLDIQTLPRNEQLAYWLNLHNVALVEQIALNWPMRQPREFEINDVPLDDAKIISVKGMALSLKDIREKIVYRHWKNPKVIYGFWRGEIGGPAIQRKAFNAKNVSNLLDKAAREFVNSLRGTQKSGSKLQVSTLYAETAQFFFPNLESDVRSHITEYANGDVLEILNETSKLEATVREYDIADISGGARQPPIYGTGSARVPPAMATLLQQRRRKFDLMIREGVRTGSVTFSNIDLPGDPENKGEVE